MPECTSFVVGPSGLDTLIGWLREEGYDAWGPVVDGGAVVPGRVAGAGDLPVGWHDRQEAGSYRLERGRDPEMFGWAVGPGSWKACFFPPDQEVWTARRSEGTFRLDGAGTPRPDGAGAPSGRPVALVGMRPCEVAALGILDRVFLGSPVPDDAYDRRRAGAFTVAVECSTPAATCFCPSMGTGPDAGPGTDLVMTELGGDGTGEHRFLVRAGSERGTAALAQMGAVPAAPADVAERESRIGRARAQMRRRLDAERVPALLARNIGHPRSQEVAERCLGCGNCTLVCPTCFCSDVHDTSDLRGDVTRRRTWASCFDLQHSYLTGGPVHGSRASRFRQWMTHKLSTWWDQFGSSGCVGCGRCITWCPVGIDITEEAAAIAATDGSRGAA